MSIYEGMFRHGEMFGWFSRESSGSKQGFSLKFGEQRNGGSVESKAGKHASLPTAAVKLLLVTGWPLLVALALSCASAVPRTSYEMQEPTCTTARSLRILSQVIPMRELSKVWRVMMLERCLGPCYIRYKGVHQKIPRLFFFSHLRRSVSHPKYTSG